MSSKSIPISVRLTSEDADFLAGYDSPGAITPSDKIRAILQKARLERLGAKDYISAVNYIRNMVQPVLDAILKTERTNKMHSELVVRYAQWMTESLAFFLTDLPYQEQNIEEAQLIQFEQQLTSHILSFTEGILRMGVTEEAPCYSKNVIRTKLSTIIELADLIKRQLPNSNKGA